MPSTDNRPSQSLINAAITSLVSDPAAGAGWAGVAARTAMVTASTIILGPAFSMALGGILATPHVVSSITQLYYSSMIPSISASGQSIPRQHFREPLKPDMQCFAPEFDYDFINIRDDGKTFVRGNHRYERPCGSYRLALKVKDKFGQDNAWLGMKGNEPDEWPVSYHGTAQHNALSIAEEGYKLSKGKHFLYGKGIYSTPEVSVAIDYASKFQENGASYKCLLQNRVNPKYMKVIPKSENGVGTYWLSAADRDGVDESELLRPYGICFSSKIDPIVLLKVE